MEMEPRKTRKTRKIGQCLTIPFQALAIKEGFRHSLASMRQPRLASITFDDGSVSALFRWWLRGMGWILRIAPFCFVLALPVVIVCDRFSPWPVAIDALFAYPGQSRVCVGNSSSSESTPDGHHWSVQRSFVLFPRVFTSPSVIVVTATDSAAVTIEESRSFFWFLFVAYTLALIYCVRLVTIFRSKRHAQSNATA